MGTVGGLFGFGRFVVHQGTGGTGQSGLCRRLLRNLVRISRRDRQCAAPGRDDFLLSVRLCAGVLRLSHDSGRSRRRSFQNASSRSSFYSGRIGGLIRRLFVVNEGICHLYRAIHCSFETNPSGLSGPFLLYFFGVDGFLVLRCMGRSSIERRVIKYYVCW